MALWLNQPDPIFLTISGDRPVITLAPKVTDQINLSSPFFSANILQSGLGTFFRKKKLFCFQFSSSQRDIILCNSVLLKYVFIYFMLKMD